MVYAANGTNGKITIDETPNVPSDISTDINSEIRLFADDCVYYREIKDTMDTLKLQKDIHVDQLRCWARNSSCQM